jgi:quinol monooxygenase YgiN
MMRPAEAGNKYIVGWIELREGTEAAFDRIVAPYVATCREEPECRFFHMMRTPDEPRTVLICECFLSEEAHAIHLDRPHVRAFFEELHRIASIGRFENVIAGAVNPDGHDFVSGRPVG